LAQQVREKSSILLAIGVEMGIARHGLAQSLVSPYKKHKSIIPGKIVLRGAVRRRGIRAFEMKCLYGIFASHRDLFGNLLPFSAFQKLIIDDTLHLYRLLE
jgi:hypothetical protein